MPPIFLGKSPWGGKWPFHSSDTFFSVSPFIPTQWALLRIYTYTRPSIQDYPEHYPPEYILSSTEHSLIIANIRGADKRLYPSWRNSRYIPGQTPEGQAYGHALVIPRGRVESIHHEASNLGRGFIRKEMRQHWDTQIANPEFRKKLNARTQQVFEEAVTQLTKPMPGEELKDAQLEEFQRRFDTEYRDSGLLDQMRAEMKVQGEVFMNLKSEHFALGTHGSQYSVAHLHFHGYTWNPDLRTQANVGLDEKTIPDQATSQVMEDEHPEQGWGSRDPYVPSDKQAYLRFFESVIAYSRDFPPWMANRLMLGHERLGRRGLEGGREYWVAIYLQRTNRQHTGVYIQVLATQLCWFTANVNLYWYQRRTERKRAATLVQWIS